jgi:hypothetical protein
VSILRHLAFNLIDQSIGCPRNKRRALFLIHLKKELDAMDADFVKTLSIT